MRYVFDANIISWLLANNRELIAQMNERVQPEDIILGCPVVWYEIRRGLLAKDARRQIQRFESLYATFFWQDYLREDWALAADLWASRRAQGQPIKDADLLIAVFAHNRNAVLVSDNVKDFADLGVTIENWMIH